MSKITEFFEKAGHDFKVIGQDIVKVISKLFGAQALTQLETTAETLLKSELGQAVLGDAETLLAQVTTGQISQQTAITSLAASTIAAAKKTGVALESSIATAVASLAIAKLTGVLNTPAAATSAAVAAVTQPGEPAAPAPGVTS